MGLVDLTGAAWLPLAGALAGAFAGALAADFAAVFATVFAAALVAGFATVFALGLLGAALFAGALPDVADLPSGFAIGFAIGWVGTLAGNCVVVLLFLAAGVLVLSATFGGVTDLAGGLVATGALAVELVLETGTVAF